MKNNFTFALDGIDEYLALHEKDMRAWNKLNKLMADIDRNGHDGIGHPKPLRGNLAGYWSREIDKKNRLVYRILDDGSIEIIQCLGHYDDK
ncbi:MAG: Txe/YoeB family addiction module toxin [Defluviitaleaceae bacterium]|nr:Txe/YoeB family addiction module toxin [Defluviitaleaceae bacterium]